MTSAVASRLAARLDSVAGVDAATEVRAESDDLRPGASLVGIGTALPEHELDREGARERLATLWGLRGAKRAWWDRIVDGSRIDRRHAVHPLEEVMPLGTAARMRLFAASAPPLAQSAAARALADAGISPEAVTDLNIVTCTGFGAPGVDVDLIRSLGLAPTVRRTQIGFMGCFGAVTGLRTAAAACAADPHAVALTVCVELCTLHLRADTATDNLVSTALFGDAAAAAVVVGGSASAPASDLSVRSGRSLRVGRGAPQLLLAHRDAMTWTVTDCGFAMTLDRRVPEIIRETIGDVATRAGFDRRRDLLAVHPGGAAILAAVDEGLELGGSCGIESAWSVLRDPGNVSSATLLFVLQRLLATAPPPSGPSAIELLAFGPGLTVENITLGP